MEVIFEDTNIKKIFLYFQPFQIDVNDMQETVFKTALQGKAKVESCLFVRQSIFLWAVDKIHTNWWPIKICVSALATSNKTKFFLNIQQNCFCVLTSQDL